MFERRGWSRSRARDYYDLWRLLGEYGNRLNLEGFELVLREKCAVRAVPSSSPGDFFYEQMLAYVDET